jgi:plasmid stability protein
MKKVNLKEKARQVRWTTEHTLTESQFRDILTKKLARAEKFKEFNELVRVKLKT